jgi:hypothetical protein
MEAILRGDPGFAAILLCYLVLVLVGLIAEILTEGGDIGLPSDSPEGLKPRAGDRRSRRPRGGPLPGRPPRNSACRCGPRRF